MTIDKYSYSRNIDKLAEMMAPVIEADVFAEDFNPEVWLDRQMECVAFAVEIGDEFWKRPARVIMDAKHRRWWNYGGQYSEEEL